MKTLVHFKEFCDEIRTSASRKFKQEVLTKYKDDEVIKKYLKINYDPYTVYGISTKKLTKRVRPEFWYQAPTVFDLFDYLTKHNTGADVDVAACQEMLYVAAELDVELENLLMDLICKDLSLGVDTKVINQIMPDLIGHFEVMLAEKYFDRPQYVEGKEFAITTKLDGFRLIVLKEQDGSIKCYSRVGQLVEGLIEIEEEIRNQLHCNTALDGELTISNYFDMPSKDAYKAASKIIRLKGDTPKTGLTYRVFDCMTADEFKAQQCDKTYVERRTMLESFPAMIHVEVLPVLYQGSDTSKITEWLTKITNEGGEGCMVNLTQAKYSWKRSRDLLKVKKFNSLDLEVIDIEEGSGRLAGTLGAIHVRYKNGNPVKVGSGFSDEERKLYWAHPELIMNRVVEVKFFEETQSATGECSLRFPTWVSNIRDPKDKATPDF
jgi:DNA ligase-1